MEANALPAQPPQAALRESSSIAIPTTPLPVTESSGAGGHARRPADTEDAVLSLKSCRHTFHRECLAAWCLQWRYDCPVCRKPYHRGMMFDPGPLVVDSGPIVSYDSRPAVSYIC